MSQFKRGDRVKIKDWDEMAKEFGTEDRTRSIKCHCGFIKDMCYLCGHEATISYISERIVTLEDYDDPQIRDGRWSISTDMIKFAEPKTIEEEIEQVLRD